MRERTIESYLRDCVKAAGGKAYKWVSPGNAGVPDRLVVMPGGKVYPVELKAPGGKMTPLQLARHRELEKLGCKVYVIDSTHQVDKFLSEIGG